RERRRERGKRVRMSVRGEHVEPRLGERRDRAKRFDRLARKPRDARVDQCREIAWNRQLLAGSDRSAPARERSRELESEQRVAGRGPLEAVEDGTRKRRSQPLLEELVDGAKGQRPDLGSTHAFGRQRSLERV